MNRPFSDYDSEHAQMLRRKSSEEVLLNYLETTQSGSLCELDRYNCVLWLIRAAKLLRLSSSNLSIYLLDAYLSKVPTSEADLIGLASGCIYISYMLERVKDLDCDQLSSLTDDSISIQTAVYWRNKVMETLEFSLHRTTPSDFVCFLYERIGGNLIFEKAKLLTEICCLDYELSRKESLVIGLAAFYLNCNLFGVPQKASEVLNIASWKFAVNPQLIIDTAELIQRKDLTNKQDPFQTNFDLIYN